MIGKRRDKREKNNECKDDIRSLDGLKTTRQSMQKLKESHKVENLGKS